MDIQELDYELPPELIAQQPADQRDRSRLMIVDRRDGSITHGHFADVVNYLHPGDCMAMNDSRVIPARVYAHRTTGGRVELLFVRPQQQGWWHVLARPAGRLRDGEILLVDQQEHVYITRDEHDNLLARIDPDGGEDTSSFLKRRGSIPLPPYIARHNNDSRQATDRVRYQTVYAARDGSIAAPTAGLHFTTALLDSIRQMGVSTATVTLHVGPGTFQPVRTDTVETHTMDAEWYDISPQTVDAITRTAQAGRRVLAVGTTTVRTLEHAAAGGKGQLQAGQGFADLFIFPPFRFTIVTGLITNFHLPRSTLLALVGAFMGMDLLKQAYRQAVEHRYRFYSYGDAMLIL